ncbi:hypothetical protein FIU94_00450 [Sulfitobacter sp. THAF37]|uniref:hypothetical protein n=1 Tax=Sulfitobacter sp. THAF37 TaxID=2587855 RepID=UPI0012690D14|nr:hypothetical protein [Sulfitobacter sp. THAF37]QFT57277.1 hypothetical protein FIU94_00450 [Sulfitobacter sp. THAF37]
MTFRFSSFGSWGKSHVKSTWNSHSNHHKYFSKTWGHGSDGTGKGSDGTGKGSDGSHKWWDRGSDGTGKGSDGTGKGSDATGKGSGKGSDGTAKGSGKGSDGTGKGSGGDACGGNSYHNGGIEGSKFSKWYDNHLSDHFSKSHFADKFDRWFDGHDGTGKGSDGTGKGSDGTGKGSDGTGKWWSWGSDGTGKGSDGTGKGSDGTGKGSDGTGKGSDGSGKWWSWGSDGTGKGSDGTGKGSDGTGKGSCGTKGSEEPETPTEEPDDGKVTYHYTMGDEGEIDISVTQDLQGQLFVSISQTSFDGAPTDIDGLFFNLTDDSELDSLNFFPDENAPGYELTDVQAEADSVTTLPSGAGVDQPYDVGLQFGQVADSSEGVVTQTNFTLWSDDGAVTIDDIDFAGMRLVVDSETGDGEVLGVSASDDPAFDPADAAADSEITLEDVMGLMTVELDEDEELEEAEEEEDLMEV